LISNHEKAYTTIKLHKNKQSMIKTRLPIRKQTDFLKLRRMSIVYVVTNRFACDFGAG